MSLKICGKNRINLPTRGCSECDELEQRVEAIEEWIEQHPGGGGSIQPVIVNLDDNIYNASCEDRIFVHTDLTYQEITEALLEGRNVYFLEPNNTYRQVVGAFVDAYGVQIGVVADVNRNGVVQTELCWFYTIAGGILEYPSCQY